MWCSFVVGLVVKDKQEDGGFSLVVLSISVVLYITITCMTFAGLVVTRPNVGAAFLDFTKEYGALLAGIPVLIAVLVAKQQLDASRKQHVATIKYNLRNEINEIDNLKEFCQSVLQAFEKGSITAFSQQGFLGVPIYPPSESDIKNIKSIFNNDLWIYAEICRDAANRAINFQLPQQDGGADKTLKSAGASAMRLEGRINEEEARLAKYWS